MTPFAFHCQDSKSLLMPDKIYPYKFDNFRHTIQGQPMVHK